MLTQEIMWGWHKILGGILVSLATPCLALAQRTLTLKPLHTLTIMLSVCQMPAATDYPALLGALTNRTLQGRSGNPRPNLQDMFRVCSNHKMRFSTDIVQPAIHIPCPKFGGVPQCRVEEWAQQADAFAKKTLRIPLHTYRYIMYVLPKGDPCGFGGLGTIGPDCGGGPCRIWISGSIPLHITAYFHELGHNLGLMHASAGNDQYGDLTDAMGYCCRMRCFAAPNLHKLRWATPALQLMVPLQTPANVVLGPGQYVLIQDALRRENTFVQFRRAKNGGLYDADISLTAVNIYVVPQQPYAMSNYVGMLWQRGNTWQNLYSLKVSLLELSWQGARIMVEPSHMMIASFTDVQHMPL